MVEYGRMRKSTDPANHNYRSNQSDLGSGKGRIERQSPLGNGNLGN